MNEVATIDSKIAAVERRICARCDAKEVTRTVKLIMGRYNQKPQGDPDLYVRQMAALLAEYPADVVRVFQKPAHDPLPTSDFLPSVSTVKEAADRLAGYLEKERASLLQTDHTKMAIEQQLATREADDNFHTESAEVRAEHVAEKLKGTFMQSNSVPAWCLDENDNLSAEDRERLEDYRRKEKLFARTQCAPGAAIAEHLKAEAEAE